MLSELSAQQLKSPADRTDAESPSVRSCDLPVLQ